MCRSASMFLLLGILSGCSDDVAGPGSGSSSDQNLPPIADAGEGNFRVLEGTVVTLDGGGSMDPEDGLNLTYSWTGPVPLNGPNTPRPSFTAPAVEFYENMDFTLTVTDPLGKQSEPDTVRIQVIADAGDLKFTWPVAGVAGADYALTAYPDIDGTEGSAVDFTGGGRAWDGGNYTDARLATFRKRDAGVDVYAIAPGVVVDAFDELSDEPDTPCPENGRTNNQVAVRHAGGLLSYYTTLRQGSVPVEVGDRVTESTVIGQIGTSRCEFRNNPRLLLYVERLGPTADAPREWLRPFSAQLWDESEAAPRSPPAYDQSASVLEVVLEADGIDSDDPFDDARDTPPENDSAIGVGDEMGVAVWIGGALPGEFLQMTWTGPLSDGGCGPFDLTPGSGPWFPALWYCHVVASEPGSWEVQVLINGQVVSTHGFDAELIPGVL